MQEKDFVDLTGLMAAQKLFETQIEGTDGTLWDHNTPEYALTRGIIGEAQECLEEIRLGNHQYAREEAIDILIFLGSLFNHLGLDSDTVSQMAQEKMERNFQKYHVDNFRGRTIDEGIRFSRRNWK